jgi:hypothetical protein
MESFVQRRIVSRVRDGLTNKDVKSLDRGGGGGGGVKDRPLTSLLARPSLESPCLGAVQEEIKYRFGNVRHILRQG